jgi:hypothetical protein
MDRSRLLEYLYVPCVRIRRHGYPAGTHRWVQEVPIVKKTATLIYYGSDSWDRREAVVSPGCISRQQFEAAGVVPIPGQRHRPGPAGRLFFASREAAEAVLRQGENERTERGRPRVSAIRELPIKELPIKELRRAMVDAHPDRGGSADQFIEARRRYERALRADAA